MFHDDPTLSREHAAVVDTPEGYRLKDLGSRNGVLLNGERLESYAEVPIAAGDVFQAGDTQIALVTMAELEAARAEAEQSGESITVDEAGKTGYQPAVQLGDEFDFDGEFDGEVTSELVRPLELDAGRELALPIEGSLDPGDDAGWADESNDDLEDEPAEALSEDDFVPEDLDDLVMEEVEDDDPLEAVHEGGPDDVVLDLVLDDVQDDDPTLETPDEVDLETFDDLDLDDLGEIDDSDLDDLKDSDPEESEVEIGSELRRRPIDDLLVNLPKSKGNSATKLNEPLDDLLAREPDPLRE